MFDQLCFVLFVFFLFLGTFYFNYTLEVADYLFSGYLSTLVLLLGLEQRNEKVFLNSSRLTPLDCKSVEWRFSIENFFYVFKFLVVILSVMFPLLEVLGNDLWCIGVVLVNNLILIEPKRNE